VQCLFFGAEFVGPFLFSFFLSLSVVCGCVSLLIGFCVWGGCCVRVCVLCVCLYVCVLSVCLFVCVLCFFSHMSIDVSDLKMCACVFVCVFVCMCVFSLFCLCVRVCFFSICPVLCFFFICPLMSLFSILVCTLLFGDFS